MSQPFVSVIVSVYNSRDYIAESLTSILNQTYKNLEIILVDDACTDDSIDIVQSFDDTRIKLIRNSKNLGLAASLNKAIRAAAGDYLARMDADDVCELTRIEKQVRYLETHAETDVVGSAMQYIGFSSYLNYFPEHDQACKSQLLFNVCFGHPSVMFRKRVFAEPANFYKEALKQYSEEFDLWCRLSGRYRFHNLPDVLLYYRTFPPAVKGDAENQRMKNSEHIRRAYLQATLHDFTEEDFKIHQKAAQLDRLTHDRELQQIDQWFERILELNRQHAAFSEPELKRQLANRFFEICYRNAHLGVRAYQRFRKSKWSGIFIPSLSLRLKFWINMILKR